MFGNDTRLDSWTGGTVSIGTLTTYGGSSPRLIVHPITGNIDITNNLTIGETLKITGGSPGNGKVLTSDATGLASWKNIPNKSKWKSSGEIAYRSGNVGIGLSTPLAPLHIKSGNTASIILESSVSNIRPGIKFINNTSHYISGDDKSNETFGFYSTWSSNRNYNAKLRVYGKARGSWGKYIEFTHDGTDATINTDAGNLTIAPAGKEVIIDGKITTPSTGNNDLKAYAYGTINANGSTVSGTGNFHIDTGAGTGIYKIIFNGGVYDDKHFTTVVTMHNTYWPSFIFCYATSNTLVVKIFNSDGRTRTNGKFSFVTYKN
jgi:hypothetical protein